MEITDDMMWPLKFLIRDKPHLFSDATKQQFDKFFHDSLNHITGRRGKSYMLKSALSQTIKLDEKDIPTQNKTNKIILMVQYYEIENAERKQEIVRAIQTNINNNLIDQIIIFVDCAVEELKNITSCFQLNEKVRLISKQTRMTYRSAINFANELNDKDAVFLLANNDCCFDETIGLMKKIDFLNGKRVLSMTRKDLLKTGDLVNAVNPEVIVGESGELIQKTDYQNGLLIGVESSDAWAFTSGLCETNANIDIELGRYHCEQQFLGRIYEDGYDVRNVGFCGHIKCIHIHQSFYRKAETYMVDESDKEYYNFNYMTDFWEDDLKADRNYDNYVVNSWMNFHKNNYFIDDRFSGEYGKFVVRDLKELF